MQNSNSARNRVTRAADGSIFFVTEAGTMVMNDDIRDKALLLLPLARAAAKEKAAQASVLHRVIQVLSVRTVLSAGRLASAVAALGKAIARLQQLEMIAGARTDTGAGINPEQWQALLRSFDEDPATGAQPAWGYAA